MLIARNFEDPNYISGFLHNGWEVVCSPYFLHIPHRSRACSIYIYEREIKTGVQSSDWTWSQCVHPQLCGSTSLEVINTTVNMIFNMTIAKFIIFFISSRSLNLKHFKWQILNKDYIKTSLWHYLSVSGVRWFEKILAELPFLHKFTQTVSYPSWVNCRRGKTSLWNPHWALVKKLSWNILKFTSVWVVFQVSLCWHTLHL